MKVLDQKDETRSFPICVIVSRFNQPVTQPLLDGALKRLNELNFKEDQIQVIWVPGAVEIPLVAQQAARLKRFEAIVCLGAVIRGETSHYDYVCEQVSQGTQRVSLDYNIPVVFGVLTTDNVEQAKDRLGGNHGHKGIEAIDTAVEMAALMYPLGN